MTFSPASMPRRRVDHAATPDRPVYTTTTGQSPRGEYAEDAGLGSAAWDLADPEPFCFVCGRCTDHVGEHEALVEAGLARYSGDGSVYKTEAWDAEVAAKVSEAEYQAYLAHRLL